MVDASKYKSRALRALVTEVGTDTRRQLRDLYESSAAQQDDLTLLETVSDASIAMAISASIDCAAFFLDSAID